MGKNIGIVLAGGIGQRFGGDKPKQYFKINGKEIVVSSLNAYLDWLMSPHRVAWSY